MPLWPSANNFSTSCPATPRSQTMPCCMIRTRGARGEEIRAILQIESEVPKVAGAALKSRVLARLGLTNSSLSLSESSLDKTTQPRSVA